MPSLFDCFLVSREPKTLAVRMRQHCENALARRQMNGYGGMVSAVLAGGVQEARRFLERCRVFCLAESLGGVESLVEHPVS